MNILHEGVTEKQNLQKTLVGIRHFSLRGTACTQAGQNHSDVVFRVL
ncbi:MAG: hypothetical protein ACKO7Y_00430 [Candidatus Nitrosotenuis sp.]